MPKNTIPAIKFTHSIPDRETEKSRAMYSVVTRARVFPFEKISTGLGRPEHVERFRGPGKLVGGHFRTLRASGSRL